MKIALSLLGLALLLTSPAAGQDYDEKPNPARLQGLTVGISTSLYANRSDVTGGMAGAVKGQMEQTFRWRNADVYLGYGFGQGTFVELGYGYGHSGSVSLFNNFDNTPAGNGLLWNLRLHRLTARLTQRWALGDSRWAIGPQVGVVYSLLAPDQQRPEDLTLPVASPETNPDVMWHFYTDDLQRSQTFSYEVGGECSYQFSLRSMLSLNGFYTNSFRDEYIARARFETEIYGRNSAPTYSQTKLEAWVASLTYRYLLIQNK